MYLGRNGKKCRYIKLKINYFMLPIFLKYNIFKLINENRSFGLNYALDDRQAEQRLLPLAADRGMAVLDPVKLVLSNWAEVFADQGGASHLEPCALPALPHPPEGTESPVRHLTLGREELAEQPVFYGGPVQTERGFVLHTTDWSSDGSLQVNGELALTASLDILKAVAGGGGAMAARS